MKDLLKDVSQYFFSFETKDASIYEKQADKLERVFNPRISGLHLKHALG